MVEELRASDYVSNSQEEVLRFMRLPDFGREIYIPIFMTAGKLEKALLEVDSRIDGAVSSFRGKMLAGELSSVETDLQDALAKDEALCAALTQVFDLSMWLLGQLLGPRHAREVKEIAAKFRGFNSKSGQSRFFYEFLAKRGHTKEKGRTPDISKKKNEDTQRYDVEKLDALLKAMDALVKQFAQLHPTLKKLTYAKGLYVLQSRSATSQNQRFDLVGRLQQLEERQKESAKALNRGEMPEETDEAETARADSEATLGRRAQAQLKQSQRVLKAALKALGECFESFEPVVERLYADEGGFFGGGDGAQSYGIAQLQAVFGADGEWALFSEAVLKSLHALLSSNLSDARPTNDTARNRLKVTRRPSRNARRFPFCRYRSACSC